MSLERVNQSEIQQICDQAVDALIAAVGQRDKTAEGHSRRVTRYSLAIGHMLGLSSEELETLKHAAGLHDVGKVAISKKIVNKFGKLTPEEFEIMKQHSVISLKIIERIGALQDSALLVKHHHERYDGKGYPDGLAGEDIPLGSRIISVAEAFDILTSDVPWRNAMDQASALKELEACSGTQFDPSIVSAIKTAITNGFVEV